MTTMQYASEFTELSRFVLEFVSSKILKMRRFEEVLAFYIYNPVASQPILTYQELFEQAAKVEWSKSELKVLNPINQKRKWSEWGAPSENVNQKKLIEIPPLKLAQARKSKQ